MIQAPTPPALSASCASQLSRDLWLAAAGWLAADWMAGWRLACWLDGWTAGLAALLACFLLDRHGTGERTI